MYYTILKIILSKERDRGKQDKELMDIRKKIKGKSFQSIEKMEGLLQKLVKSSNNRSWSELKKIVGTDTNTHKCNG